MMDGEYYKEYGDEYYEKHKDYYKKYELENGIIDVPEEDKNKMEQVKFETFTTTSGTSDPLNQRATSGWKSMFVSRILNDNFMHILVVTRSDSVDA